MALAKKMSRVGRSEEMKSKRKSYSVSIAIHGHIHYSVKAESEAAAKEAAYEKYGKGKKADHIEWETGYPCEIGWEEADVVEENEAISDRAQTDE